MLAAVCLLALAAAAHARPDALAPASAPAQINSYTYHNASVDEQAPEAASTPDPPSGPAPAPLHQRYPHAVLFGGTCGGTIIGPSWVLTAGHCTLFTGGRSVLAGASRSDDGSGTQVRVKKLHLHPRFSVGPYWLNANKFDIQQVAARWDFMLVELESPLALDGVNMAAAALDGAPAAPAQPADYAGFGAEHHGGLMRPDMHARELRVVSDERCAALEQYDPQDMLCAEGRTTSRDSACNGDSGSGLVVSGEGAGAGARPLLGVASWVQGDAHECRAGALVVFSRVAAARAWIKRVSGI